jgi:hypothetical protein
MKFTFDVTKCDKLFYLLLQNNIIRLKGGACNTHGGAIGSEKIL